MRYYNPNSEPVDLTREELYELVWKHPLSKLASDFAMTGTALAKRCRRLKIPIPGLGYWAKVAAGKKVTRLRLPPAPKDAPKLVRLWQRFRPPAVSLGGPPSIEPLEAPTSLGDDAHPLVRASHEVLSSSVAEDGFLRFWTHPDGRRCASIYVSPATLPRALCLLEGIARGASHIGWTLANDPDTRAYILVEGVKVPFVIMELRKQASDGKTLIPNGRLQIALGSEEEISSDVRRIWKDGSAQRIEGALHKVLLGAWNCAQQLRAWQELREAQQRAYEAQEKARQAERERRLREEAWTKELAIRLTHLVRSRDIRALIDAVLRSDPTGARNGPDWLEWLKQQADLSEFAAVFGTSDEDRSNDDADLRAVS